MNSTINLNAIYIANLLGILLCFVMLFTNKWKLREKDIESKCVKHMIILAVIACIVDPMVFSFDGKHHVLAIPAVYWGNFYLFASNMLLGPLWILLISHHVLGTLPKIQKILIGVFVGLGGIILIYNLFIPVVFYVDANANYHRAGLYLIYTIIELICLTDGIFIYYNAKIKGGIFKFFPILQFIIPVIIGISLQVIFYGVSTIWPCISISIMGILNSLQNEKVFQDQLTGLYNRYYLDNIKKELSSNRNSNITVMMIDMNDFKSINDSFGHHEGDLALITVGNILRTSVGELGSVIRYAGDEFLILLNTQEEEVINKCQRLIHKNILIENNKKSEYQLSLSIGSCALDLRIHSIDEVLNLVDHKMYEAKKEYYSTHDRRKR